MMRWGRIVALTEMPVGSLGKLIWPEYLPSLGWAIFCERPDRISSVCPRGERVWNPTNGCCFGILVQLAEYDGQEMPTT